jgi:hypothetical protein
VHVGRKDLAAEATAPAVLSFSPVIDTRRPHLDRAGAERHLPRLGLPVADNLRPDVIVSFLVARDVVGDLGFESLGEHPAGALAGDLVKV